jgi:hypothetical protein
MPCRKPYYLNRPSVWVCMIINRDNEFCTHFATACTHFYNEHSVYNEL